MAGVTGAPSMDDGRADTTDYVSVGSIQYDESTGIVEVIGTSSGDTVDVRNLAQGMNLLTGETIGSGYISVSIQSGTFTPVTREFESGDVVKIVFDGQAGDDVFINNTDFPCDIEGGDGEDTLTGGGGNDILRGGKNVDTINGGEGADELYGGRGVDTLLGGNGDDRLEGGEQGDTLKGEDGNDLLYGGDGDDTLKGGAGLDSLFGGADVDHLVGGGGADRFLLNLVDTPAAPIPYPEDTVQNIADEDALVYFGDTDAQFIDFGGSTYLFDQGSWTDEEILAVDEALALLVERTGNTTLLKTAMGGPIWFYRTGAEMTLDRLTGQLTPSQTFSGWNSGGGQMTLADETFDRDGDGALDADHDYIHQVVTHEIGHNWDAENANWEDWLDLSGWTQSALEATLADYPWGFSISLDGQWFYDTSKSNEFVRDLATSDGYSLTNPYEDFATAFSYYFIDGAGEDYAGANQDNVERSLLADKLGFIEAFLDDLSATR
jgi:hypothetical protein